MNNGVYRHRHNLIHPQDECARILHAPIDVRNIEARGRIVSAGHRLRVRLSP